MTGLSDPRGAIHIDNVTKLALGHVLEDCWGELWVVEEKTKNDGRIYYKFRSIKDGERTVADKLLLTEVFDDIGSGINPFRVDVICEFE